jgi:hypothetical protein
MGPDVEELAGMSGGRDLRGLEQEAPMVAGKGGGFEYGGLEAKEVPRGELATPGLWRDLRTAHSASSM